MRRVLLILDVQDDQERKLDDTQVCDLLHNAVRMNDADALRELCYHVQAAHVIPQMTADTGDAVASLAGRYATLGSDDIIAMGASDETGTLERFAGEVRSMATSLLRQNEHD